MNPVGLVGSGTIANPWGPFSIIAITGLFLFAALLAAGIFLFWLKTLIDAITKKKIDSVQKVIWVLVIIFLGLLGSIIYYLIVKPRPSFGSGLGKWAKWLFIIGLAGTILFAVILIAMTFAIPYMSGHYIPA
ncbi:MAG: PLDc N-terminal domain-containing protein [archaeon]